MSSLHPTILCHYAYDPLDRLINHTQSDTPRLQRFYCKSRLATEIQGAMQHSIFQHDDQLLAQQRKVGDVSVNALLATDQQRSVLYGLDKTPTPQSITYSPYGHRRGESGLTSLLGFNGERPDPVTGHYLLGNGYRAFNPVLMRFNSPDSLSPFGRGGLNPYTYCLGDPVNRYDPTGHISWMQIKHFRGEATRKIMTNAKNLKTPTAGFDELAYVEKNNGILLSTGRGKPQQLDVNKRNGSISPQDVIALRNELVDIEYRQTMQNDSDYFFGQLEAASNDVSRSGRLNFLEGIMDDGRARGFNQDRVNAIIERGLPSGASKEMRDIYTHAVEFNRGLEQNYSSAAMNESRERARAIRSQYFK